MTTRFTILVLAALGASAACSAFGSDDGEPKKEADTDAGTSSADASGDAATAARSVFCKLSPCTGADQCCIDSDQANCAPKCTTPVTFECDDTADCAASGLVCCLNFVSDNPSAAGLKSASCRSEASCTGASFRRMCKPPGTGECAVGKGCIPLTQLYPTVFPGFPVSVCE